MYQFLLVINTFYNANNFLFLFLSEFIQQDKLKLMW